MTTQDLLEQLRSITGGRTFAAEGPTALRYLYGGIEHREDPAAYYWDGMRRGGDPEHPIVIIQYTLAGYGRYEQDERRWDLPPGHCFLSVVPTPHRYFLPIESRSWTFFYLIATHAYGVSRLTRIAEQFGPVHALPPDALPIARMVEIIQGLCLSAFVDDLAVEQKLLDMVLEFERYARRTFYPSDRQQLLESVRRHVLTHLDRNITVDELAQGTGMSRSHFSHYFRATTGMPPAQFVTDVRLDEVSRRLTQTNRTLKEIARETGFADANHLCKVFRRRLGASPGQFRRRIAS